MHKTCIVVPCYNEGERLQVKTYIRFLNQNQCSFYFVNDGSKDNTLKVLYTIKNECPDQVEVVNLSINSGKGEAVRQGFLAAFKNKKFDYIGYFDADLATPLDEIEHLLRYLEKDIKVVIGSRVKRLGSEIKRYPIRHYLGRVFATMASVTLDLDVYDSQCGAKIFKTKTAKDLFSEPFQSKWLFDLELLYRLKHMKDIDFNNIILEVPLRRWQEKGDTRIKVIDFITIPFDLVRIKNNTL